ncbi:MAG: SDR family oxidoreductase [Rickettsiales bacterium]|jgi:NAD(P)-dependent dehydrogenase (short-subunit alcohol dehydrogenase family)|nr:SDR family oxidoreductase [Rickettsiales bacterium]
MKKVLITGGTGAIGGAIVAEFAKNPNYDIWFSYNNEKARADEIAARYGARAIQIKDNDISAAPNDIDILVNNAGIFIYSNLAETITDDDMRKTMEVNFILPFQLSKKMLPHMKSKKWGRIINISSICAIKNGAESLAYNASKSALDSMTKTIAKEYGQFGITVNSVLPSTVDVAGMGFESMKKYGFEEEYQANIESCPVGRLLLAHEIAPAASFLASDDAAFINGVILPVDGGQTA